MFVVHRFPLVKQVNVLVIPESSKLLSVGIGTGGAPSVWYTMESDKPYTSQMFQVVVIEAIPTGANAGDVPHPRIFLGTVSADGKVCHMFRWGGIPNVDHAKANEFQALSGQEELLDAAIGLCAQD